MNLAEQVVMTGGLTTHRLDEHMRLPASELIKQGNVPRVGLNEASRILDVRVLTEVEAQVLAQRQIGTKPRAATSSYTTDTVKVRHHAIARLLAAGHKKADITRIMGVGNAVLAVLERSPAFQALVLEYMNMMDKHAIESHTRLKILGNLGIDELTERLASKPSTIKTGEVLEIVKLAADRTGLAPTSKQVVLNGRISPADIRALKAAKNGTAPESSEEDHFGGDHDAAGVCVEGEFVEDSEAGEDVRTLAGEMAVESNDVEGLVSDLAEIFGPRR